MNPGYLLIANEAINGVYTSVGGINPEEINHNVLLKVRNLATVAENATLKKAFLIFSIVGPWGTCQNFVVEAITTFNDFYLVEVFRFCNSKVADNKEAQGLLNHLFATKMLIILD